MTKPCSSADGIELVDDSWHDDRADLELSTRCFAAKLKKIRADLGESGWIMSLAAYITSPKTIQEYCDKWKTTYFWDLPLPDVAEVLIDRLIAFAIINGHREFFGLTFQDPPPFVFDQVTGVVLVKDLTIGDLAKILHVPPREILEMNPKIKPSNPAFPAIVNGKNIVHSISVPKGKGKCSWII